MDLLESGGGGNSIGALAKQLGIGGADTGKLVEALAPALMRGVQKQTERPDTMEGLTKALAGGGHQRYLDNPELIGDDAARADGNKILDLQLRGEYLYAARGKGGFWAYDVPGSVFLWFLIDAANHRWSEQHECGLREGVRYAGEKFEIDPGGQRTSVTDARCRKLADLLRFLRRLPGGSHVDLGRAARCVRRGPSQRLQGGRLQRLMAARRAIILAGGSGTRLRPDPILSHGVVLPTPSR